MTLLSETASNSSFNWKWLLETAGLSCVGFYPVFQTIVKAFAILILINFVFACFSFFNISAKPLNCNCRFSHDVTKIQTTKLLILLIFYLNEV